MKIFSDIDRLPQLYNYYYKCHKVSRKGQREGEVEFSLDDYMRVPIDTHM